MNLVEAAEDEVIREAMEIIARRKTEAESRRVAMVDDLFNRYARKRSKEPHELGKPKALTKEESLFLFAFERNKYTVEAEGHADSQWNGEAWCTTI